jgi:hypothetical protein
MFCHLVLSRAGAPSVRPFQAGQKGGCATGAHADSHPDPRAQKRPRPKGVGARPGLATTCPSTDKGAIPKGGDALPYDVGEVPGVETPAGGGPPGR